MTGYDRLDELYTSLYGVEATKFGKLAPKAIHYVENITTGVDGFNKLRHAFPTSKTDKSCVRNCICEVIHILYQIEEAKENARLLNGVNIREDGTYTAKAISSVSSGSESITYGQRGSQLHTIYDTAAGSLTEQNALINATIKDCLSGVKDANGVNLLYRGAYPHVC